MPLKGRTQQVGLLDPLADKMHCILGSLFTRHGGNIWLLLHLRDVLSGDAMIFQTEMAPCSVGMQMGFQIVERRIETDVTITLAVNVVLRISDHSRPHLLARFYIACKYCNSVF